VINTRDTVALSSIRALRKRRDRILLRVAGQLEYLLKKLRTVVETIPADCSTLFRTAECFFKKTILIYSPDRVKNFRFSILSRPVLRSTQPPIQCVLGVKRPGCDTDHSLQLEPRSRKRGSIHPLPHTCPWRST
jgi:hypothetical protein